MSRFRLSALAQLDLEAIWLYTANEASAETADRLIDKIVRRFSLLSRHPNGGRLRKDIAPGIRCFPVHKHMIYYCAPRRSGEAVLIARILHGSRDQQVAFTSLA